MKKKNATLYYGFCMATYSVGFVAMSAFSSFYLLSIGLSNSTIGVLLAVASLAAVAMQPFIGAMIDKSHRISSRGVLGTLAVLMAVMGVFIMLLKDVSLTTKTIMYGTNMVFLMLAQPFLNSLGMEAVNYGYPMNFGVGKAMGSLGYATGAYVIGIVSEKVGPKSIPMIFTMFYVIFLLILCLYPVNKKKALEEMETDGILPVAAKKPSANPIAFFRRYKRFLFMLAGMILVYLSHSLINSFTLQIVEPKGGNSADMGTATAIAATVEMITTAVFVVYMRHFKLKNLIRTACIFFVLKIFCSYLVPNMLAFFLIQGLQMFGWGLMAVGIVYYVNFLMGDNDKAQGQAYAGMSFTIACVIATSLGGNLIDRFGVNTMLITGTIAAVIGTCIVWVTIEDVKGNA